AWIKVLEHPKRGEGERVFYDPTRCAHRLIVSRTKKTFEVQAQQPTRFRVNGKRRTFKVQTGGTLDTTIEQSRERADIILARIRRGEDPRGRSPENETSLGAAWDKFRLRSDLRPRTRAMYEGTFRRNLENWKGESLRALAMNPARAHDEHKVITKRSGPSEAD